MDVPLREKTLIIRKTEIAPCLLHDDTGRFIYADKKAEPLKSAALCWH